jgi:hypothetical protein
VFPCFSEDPCGWKQFLAYDLWVLASVGFQNVLLAHFELLIHFGSLTVLCASTNQKFFQQIQIIKAKRSFYFLFGDRGTVLLGKVISSQAELEYT